MCTHPAATLKYPAHACRPREITILALYFLLSPSHLLSYQLPSSPSFDLLQFRPIHLSRTISARPCPLRSCIPRPPRRPLYLVQFFTRRFFSPPRHSAAGFLSARAHAHMPYLVPPCIYIVSLAASLAVRSRALPSYTFCRTRALGLKERYSNRVAPDVRDF